MSGVGREIVLVDKNRDRAEAEADDIRHAVPFAHPLDISAGPQPDLGSAGFAFERGIARKQPGLGEHVAAAHKFGIDLQLADHAACQRPPLPVIARKRAADNAPANQPREGLARCCSTPPAPVARAAPLLLLRRLDAGEPHGGAANLHAVTAHGISAPLERFAARQQGQGGRKVGYAQAAALGIP